MDQQRPQVAILALADAEQQLALGFRILAGTSPSQALKWRPDLNCRASQTLANSAVAINGPTPGTAIMRRAG